MATKIQNLYSLSAGNQPGDLLPGELAYNLADGFTYLGTGGNNYVDTLGNVIGPATAAGGGWQQGIFNAAPINGSVIFGGTYDAQDNEVTAVTPQGTTAGLTVGNPLPAAAAGNVDVYVLVQIGGTLAPPAPTGTANPGDWIVSTGTAWSLVQQSSVNIPASNVTITPTGDFTGPTMQDVLNEIQLQYMQTSGGVTSSLNVNGPMDVYGNTSLGDASTDTLTVAATSTFNAPVAMGSTLTVTGNVVGAANVGAQTLSVTGAATVGGALGVTGNVTAAGGAFGALSASGNATVTGTLTATNATFPGDVTIGTSSGTSDDLLVYANSVFSTNVTINGPLSVNAATTFGGPNTYTVGSTSTLLVNGKLQVTDPINSTIAGSAIANQVIPIGGIIIWPASAIPVAPGFVRCDASALSRTTYAALFAIIGTTYGAGDGSTTFNVPDYRGVFLRGYGQNSSINNAAGVKAGSATRATGTGQADAFASHTHNFLANNDATLASLGNGYNGLYVTPGVGMGSSLGGLTSTGYVYPMKQTLQNTGGGETTPVNIAVTYLIRAL